jgi:hypothetical protein
MTDQEFKALVDSALTPLFIRAREADELSFLFAVLGINSGMEDAGWQPVGETLDLTKDLVGLINAPLGKHTQVRMALFLYCHLIEVNFLYHCIYNLLLTMEKEPPLLFSFLPFYRGDVPPTVNSKIKEINKRALKVGIDALPRVFEIVFQPQIRNAFFHSDYILFRNELRLKHKGSEIRAYPIEKALDLVRFSVIFFDTFMQRLDEACRSFPKGYRIENRKSKDGQARASVAVTVDEGGRACGFSTSDPLPIW